VRIGETLKLDDLRKNFRAVFIATGAYEEVKLDIDGEGLDGVIHCLDFLKKINLGIEVSLGKTVAVVGGGNAAIDAARVAKRLGSDVTILYRRSRNEMPANAWEVDEAEKEGVKIEFLVAPSKIHGIDKVEHIECIRMELGEPDSSGRRRPVPIKGSEFKISVNNIIVAISQKPQIDWLDEEFGRTKWGTLVVDPDTLQTNVKGIYAGGDLVSGPATVIEAVAAGKKAAEVIDASIKGVEIKHRELHKTQPEAAKLKREKRIPRLPMRKLPVDRRNGFNEVELGYDEETAQGEAGRCLNCAVCCECMQCVTACKLNAIEHDLGEKSIDIDVGALIVAPGLDVYDARKKSMYGYSRYANVITSIELERILNASGPFR
jgi:heterodisulfide reductase subunit A